MKSLNLIERLSALRLGFLRKAAVSVGLQSIHAEILEYLDNCNKYSNNAQAISEYLGITKSSVSQSLKILEAKLFIVRKPWKGDKRSSRILITAKGKKILDELIKKIPVRPDLDVESNKNLNQILSSWQKGNNFRSFGLCETCKYNEKLDNNNFRCGLTKEKLSILDTQKICREHEY